MSATSPDLASLLCSRLCHDLLSPVGAISNGLELLADESDPEMRRRCIELLEQSAQTSADKLKFFRLAFGAAGGFGETISIEEPRALVEALVALNGRIVVTWAVSAGELPKDGVKVLLNLALIAIEALVRGGSLAIAIELTERQCEMVVRASGPRIAFDPSIGQALQGTLPPQDLASRTAPAWLVKEIVGRQDGAVQVVQTEDALVLGAMVARH